VTTKNNTRLAVRDRRVTVNISIPLGLLFKIDEQCENGKRSEFITEILTKSLNS
jgi:metal-responsive CopG/Arc/MetJ family transcriptional regulator